MHEMEEEEYVEPDDEDRDPDYNPTNDPEQEFVEEDMYLDDEETFEIEKHVHAINLQKQEIRGGNTSFCELFCKGGVESKDRRRKRVPKTHTLHARNGVEDRDTDR